MIRYKVMIEPTAAEDLFEISDYITHALHEPVAANRIYRNIKEQIATLADMPKRHKVLEHEPYASIGVRMLPVKNYIVYYVVDDSRTTVHIVRVLYNRRNWQDIL